MAPLTAHALNSLRFAAFPITNQIFYQSTLSIGIVNLKPIVPGHVLIIPKRVIPRFGELSTEEVSDLYQAVHQVSRVIEKEYKALSLTVAMQDGAYAGQSVPHVHVHILPRSKDDFDPVDQIYEELDSANIAEDYQRFLRSKGMKLSAVDNEARKARTRSEMQAEAEKLAKLFPEENGGSFVEAEK